MRQKSDFKYLLALVPKALGNLDKITSNDIKLSDCIRVIYHYLFMLKLAIWKRNPGDRPWYYKEGYVPISFDMIEQLIPKNKVNEVLRLMVDNGLLEERKVDGRKSYIVGVRSTLFRIPGNLYVKKQRGFLYRKEKVTSKHIIKKVLKHKDKLKGEKITTQFKVHHSDYDTLLAMVEQFQPQTSKIEQPNINDDDLAYLNMFLDTITAGDISFKTCEFGDRLHTPFTNLKAEYRSLFRFKKHINDKHISIDAVNSQWYFLAILISKPQLVKRYIPEFKAVIPLLNECSETSDKEKFLKLTSTGILYEYWAEKRWPEEFLSDPVEARDKAKSDLSYLLFGKIKTHPSTPNYKTLHKTKELFQLEFPSIWKIIVGIKILGKEELPFMNQFYYDKKTGKYRGDALSHKNMSALLQRLESRILIGTISSRLIKKKVVFVTIHDSFLAPSKFKKIIKNEIELFFKWYKLPHPKLKTEDL